VAAGADVTMEPWQLGVAALGSAFRHGETTPAAHLAMLEARTSVLNPRLNAIIAFDPEVRGPSATLAANRSAPSTASRWW